VRYIAPTEAGPLGWTSRIGALLLAVCCSACAGVGVEFDPQEDFASYRRWAWLPRLEAPIRPLAPTPDGLTEEIESRTEEFLAARGFVRVDEEEADFFVTYHVVVHVEIVILSETNAEQHVASMNDSPSYGVTRSETRRRVYQRGHLVIDVVEGDDRQLVWRGETESKYRGSWKPHARTAVMNILERFPPESSDAEPSRALEAGS
jgi:hypothetical protein